MFVLETPLFLTADVFYEQPLVISVKYFFHRQDSLCVNCSALVQEVWGSNRGQVKRNKSCQWLATVATFLRKELCCSSVMLRRWAPQTRYPLGRNTASIIKINFFEVIFAIDLFTEHVIPVTTTQIRDSIIVLRLKSPKALLPNE